MLSSPLKPVILNTFSVKNSIEVETNDRIHICTKTLEMRLSIDYLIGAFQIKDLLNFVCLV